jgi:large subunit ribosomal protein L15
MAWRVSKLKQLRLLRLVKTTEAVTLKGLTATAGAKAWIEALGGKLVEEV